MRNDLLMRNEVVTALNMQLGLIADAIGVEVHHGFVKLAGRVQSTADRHHAERVARQVVGVTGLNIDIDVIPTIRPLRARAKI